VYLVQGLLGLSRLAVFTFFKADLQLDPAEVGFLTGLGFAPWVRRRGRRCSVAAAWVLLVVVVVEERW
jgi:hypothetical protein